MPSLVDVFGETDWKMGEFTNDFHPLLGLASCMYTSRPVISDGNVSGQFAGRACSPHDSAGLGTMDDAVIVTRDVTCSARTHSVYKHVPHRDKPPQLVQRRNARERRRVQAVNNAFVRLRRYIPYENKHKRLSKVT